MKDHFSEESLLQCTESMLCQSNSQVILITSLSGHTSRYTITKTTTIFKEYNGNFIHCLSAWLMHLLAIILNSASKIAFFFPRFPAMLIFYLPIKDLVFHKQDGLLLKLNRPYNLRTNKSILNFDNFLKLYLSNIPKMLRLHLKTLRKRILRLS